MSFGFFWLFIFILAVTVKARIFYDRHKPRPLRLLGLLWLSLNLSVLNMDDRLQVKQEQDEWIQSHIVAPPCWQDFPPLSICCVATGVSVSRPRLIMKFVLKDVVWSSSPALADSNIFIRTWKRFPCWGIISEGKTGFVMNVIVNIYTFISCHTAALENSDPDWSEDVIIIVSVVRTRTGNYIYKHINRFFFFFA